MNAVKCAVNGCKRPVDRRGWCTSHYFHWYRYGDPKTVIPRGAHKVFCKRGHDMSNAYVRPDTGLRQCRECAKERNRSYPNRKKVFIKRTVRQRLMNEANGICAYCGQSGARSLDHVVPKADRRRAGISDTDEAYLVVACLTCNIRKGTRKLVPPSWANKIAQLREVIPGHWRCWNGDPKAASFRVTYAGKPLAGKVQA